MLATLEFDSSRCQNTPAHLENPEIKEMAAPAEAGVDGVLR